MCEKCTAEMVRTFNNFLAENRPTIDNVQNHLAALRADANCIEVVAHIMTIAFAIGFNSGSDYAADAIESRLANSDNSVSTIH